MIKLKEISKTELDKLIEKGFIKNSNYGFINPKKKNEKGYAYKVTFYKTMHGRHMYMEDWYVNMAKKILENERNAKDVKSKRHFEKKH